MKEFAERAGIPVALTLHGLGGFPSEHYLCLQMLGMHGTVTRITPSTTPICCWRSACASTTASPAKLEEFAKHGRIVHIDIDPSELNKNKFAHVAVHGDLKAAVEGLNALLKKDENADLVGGGRYPDWMRQIDEWRENEPLRFPDRDDAILPQYAIRRLWQILKDRGQLDETILTTGVGQHQMWAAQYFHQNQPRHWITSGGLGTMGFGLPAAIGARRLIPTNSSSTSTATAVS